VWGQITLDWNTEVTSALDSRSVKMLRSRAPATSETDRNEIIEQFRTKKLFPKLRNKTLRDAVLKAVCLQSLILTMCTLSQDVMILRGWIHDPMKELLGKMNALRADSVRKRVKEYFKGFFVELSLKATKPSEEAISEFAVRCYDLLVLHLIRTGPHKDSSCGIAELRDLATKAFRNRTCNDQKISKVDRTEISTSNRHGNTLFKEPAAVRTLYYNRLRGTCKSRSPVSCAFMATQIIRIFLIGSPQTAEFEPLSAPTEHAYSLYNLRQPALGGGPAKPVSYQPKSSIKLDGPLQTLKPRLNKRDSCCSLTGDPLITETTGSSWSTSDLGLHPDHESMLNHNPNIGNHILQWLESQHPRNAPRLQSAPVHQCQMGQTSLVLSGHGSLIYGSSTKAGSTMLAPVASSSIYSTSIPTPISHGDDVVVRSIVNAGVGSPIQEKDIACNVTFNNSEPREEKSTPFELSDAGKGLLSVGRKETSSRSFIENQRNGDPRSTAAIDQGDEVAQGSVNTESRQLNPLPPKDTPTITFKLAKADNKLVLVCRQEDHLRTFMENQKDGDPRSKFCYTTMKVHSDHKNPRRIIWSEAPEDDAGALTDDAGGLTKWLEIAVAFVDIIFVKSKNGFLAKSSIRTDRLG
jgi:hypothetical protein